MNDLEHKEQKALIEWCDRMGPPESLIFAIPNGGHRHVAVAAKLKAEGVRAGIPDLFLPIPNNYFHGLFIEMKTKTGRPTQAQADRVAQLNKHGYCAVVCYGWDSARARIKDYLRDVRLRDDAPRQTTSCNKRPA